ncbi:MAG: GNAT family N-acetyltransferase [Magnetococcales bacterium]|nr:GNAT family N-acetyltransferase [Magnetococcales bacterium]
MMFPINKQRPPEMSKAWKITWLDAADDIPESMWDMCFPPPLEGRWWYKALEMSGLDAQFQFQYGVVSHTDRAIAIAPVFIMDVPITILAPPWLCSVIHALKGIAPSLQFHRTVFVGSPCSDEGHVGILPGVDRMAVFITIQEALPERVARFKATWLSWKDFPPRDISILQGLQHRYGLFPVVCFPGTLCDLPGPGKMDYLASLKGSRRHNLKKKWLRSAQAVALDCEILQHPDQATLDTIFALFSQTYEKAQVKFERLTRRFFELLAEESSTHFIVLKEPKSDKIVAFMLCFVFSNTMINKFIGIDYHRPTEWLLYFRLWEAAVDWALGHGIRSIQSGQTGYGPKILTGHRLLPLTNYNRHKNPVMNWLYGKIAASVSWQTIDADLAQHVRASSEEALMVKKICPNPP